MAAAEITIDVKTSAAFETMVEVVEDIGCLRDLIPEWHKVEVDQIMERIAGNVLKLISSRQENKAG